MLFPDLTLAQRKGQVIPGFELELFRPIWIDERVDQHSAMWRDKIIHFINLLFVECPTHLRGLARLVIGISGPS